MHLRLRPVWKDYAAAIVSSDLHEAGITTFGFHSLRDDVGSTLDPAAQHGLLVALGADASGHGRLLDVVAGLPGRTADWMTLILRLQQRGLPPLALHRILPGSPAACEKAIAHVMPEARLPATHSA